MRLPIVDNAHRPVELDWLRISQIGRVAATRNQLQVMRDERDSRLTWVVTGSPDDDSERHGELDAHIAGELVAAIRNLVERRPVAVDTPPGTDPWRYEVELSWSGVELRFIVDGEPVDDALHGVIDLATTLLDRDPQVANVEPRTDPTA